MLEPGDVVTVDFSGATGIKRRPAVIISSDDYHANRPDVILGILTTNTTAASTSTDHVLQESSAAGLHAPSAFRSYFGTARPSAVRVIGHLSDADWNQVKAAAHRALA